MIVTVILAVIGELGMIPKGLINWLKGLEIRRLAENIQTTALLSWLVGWLVDFMAYQFFSGPLKPK